MACEVEINDELSYGILNDSKNSISIDEGLPSEVALVCFWGVLSYFESIFVLSGHGYPSKTDNVGHCWTMLDNVGHLDFVMLYLCTRTQE